MRMGCCRAGGVVGLAKPRGNTEGAAAKGHIPECQAKEEV